MPRTLRTHRVLRTRRPLTALAAGALLLLTGCSGSTTSASAAKNGLPAAVAQTGELRVGMSPDFPPMEYLDDRTNKVVGVDVDLANALGKQLGVKVVIVQESFDELLNSVATGRVDMVMSGISDTVERQKTVDFIDYFGSRGRLYTLQSSASRFTKPTDACGKTVAVSKKTDYYQQIQDFGAAYCTKAGRPAPNLLPTDSGAAARLQLQQGRAQLAVQGEEDLVFFQKKQPGTFATVLPALPTSPFGIVVKKGDQQMAGAVLKGLRSLVANGTYRTLLASAGLGYGQRTPVIDGVKS